VFTKSFINGAPASLDAPAPNMITIPAINGPDCSPTDDREGTVGRIVGWVSMQEVIVELLDE